MFSLFFQRRRRVFAGAASQVVPGCESGRGYASVGPRRPVCNRGTHDVVAGRVVEGEWVKRHGIQGIFRLHRLVLLLLLLLVWRVSHVEQILHAMRLVFGASGEQRFRFLRLLLLLLLLLLRLSAGGRITSLRERLRGEKREDISCVSSSKFFLSNSQNNGHSILNS